MPQNIYNYVLCFIVWKQHTQSVNVNMGSSELRMSDNSFLTRCDLPPLPKRQLSGFHHSVLLENSLITCHVKSKCKVVGFSSAAALTPVHCVSTHCYLTAQQEPSFRSRDCLLWASGPKSKRRIIAITAVLAQQPSLWTHCYSVYSSILQVCVWGIITAFFYSASPQGNTKSCLIKRSKFLFALPGWAWYQATFYNTAQYGSHPW